MTTLDPAVRDLLAAIHETLNGSGNHPVAAAQVAIQSAVLYGDLTAGWLPLEAADAQRVRRADRWDLYRDALEGATGGGEAIEQP